MIWHVKMVLHVREGHRMIAATRKQLMYSTHKAVYFNVISHVMLTCRRFYETDFKGEGAEAQRA